MQLPLWAALMILRSLSNKMRTAKLLSLRNGRKLLTDVPFYRFEYDSILIDYQKEELHGPRVRGFQ